MAGASGKKLDETYKLAWVRGLKTTYYLRTLAATSAEKSTGKGGELNAVPASGGISSGSAASNTRQASGKAAPSSTAAAPRRAEVLRDRRSDVRGLPVIDRFRQRGKSSRQSKGRAARVS